MKVNSYDFKLVGKEEIKRNKTLDNFTNAFTITRENDYDLKVNQ